MGLLEEIKTQVKKVGVNKSKILYFKPDTKIRIRFLHDLDDGMKIMFHDSFEKGINVPCQELFGRDCPYCNREDLRHRDLFAWSVWDYDASDVKILLFAVNSYSPIPALVAMYETYGTLTDRDYVITKNGKGTSSSFSVVPMDKTKFKNSQAKPLSTEKVLKIIDKAFPCDNVTSNNIKNEKDVDEDFEDENEYEEMSVKELYKLCLEKGIKAKPKKNKEYYIELLEEYDESEEEEDDEDEWDE
jgi:hypothetical protein